MSTNIIPQVTPIHGRFGELWIGTSPIAEATGIEYTVEIEQVEINQVGGRWARQVPGKITGTGTMNVTKVYSTWEKYVIDYAGKSVKELREQRDRGEKIMPEFILTVTLDDPNATGKKETVDLKGVRFFQMSGGFQIGDLINRDVPFNFTGISLTQAIVAATNQPAVPTYPEQT